MKRTYVWNPETKELEEVTPGGEWLHGGTRWGREMLDKFKREGLCPVDDYTETWAKADIERKRLRGELPPTPEMRRERRQSIADSFERVRAGYKPNRRPMWED